MYLLASYKLNHIHIKTQSSESPCQEATWHVCLLAYATTTVSLIFTRMAALKFENAVTQPP